MPEEIVIVIIVIIAVLWLLFKILAAIFKFSMEVQKDFNEATTRRGKKRFAKGKSKLSPNIRVFLPNQLDEAEKKVATIEHNFENVERTTTWVAKPPDWTKKEFHEFRLPSRTEQYAEMDTSDLRSVLTPNTTLWLEEENSLIAERCTYPSQPPVSTCRSFANFPSLTMNLEHAVLEYDKSVVKDKEITRYFSEEQRSILEYNIRRARIMDKSDRLNGRIREWNDKSKLDWQNYMRRTKELTDKALAEFITASELYTAACEEQKMHFRSTREGYERGSKQHVINRMDYILGNLSLPRSVPRTWDADYDEEQHILIVEVGLPDVVHQPPFKKVVLKSGPVKKPLNQTERKEFIPKVHPAILLRVAYEVFRNDDAAVINLLVLNGWIKFDDPRTGVETKAYTASLMVEPHQFKSVNLDKVDPVAAFEGLHGKSAGRLVEIIPIEPTLSLNKKDSRFVDAKAVLGMLGSETNLAAMDWQDFEHLIRELFEKEFADRGAEVKITQASRDRGVDAIVFDPDPIHGGKYVIQAKRYTNTVDVSAVRDLCAVVKKEGASRGILVTTSTYGADAYAFANNEPVTLLNGAELLGLLKKHGYTFRINLQEARKLAQAGLHGKEKSSANS
jgi:restriction system protein